MAGQSFQTNSYGKFFAVPKLSKKLRAAAQPLMRWRQFTDKDDQFGKREGDTLLFDKILNVDAGAGAGAIIAEGQPIPRSAFKTVQSQVVAKPSGLAIGWTEELENFSEFDVRDPIKSRLVDYMAKALNFRAYEEFRTAPVQYLVASTVGAGSFVLNPTGNTTPTHTTTGNVTLGDLRNIIDALKKGNYGAINSVAQVAAPCPTYDGANYMCIGSVDFCRAIKDDNEFEDAAKYGDPERLFSGEVGRIYGTRIVEDNHILGTLVLAASSTTGKKGQAVFFGSEPVMEVVVVPEEVRIDLPADFNRDRAMAFYYLGGFSRVWNYNVTTEPENRIVTLL